MDVAPHIQLVLGPMYSGKTSELIRRVRRYTHARKRCCVIKYDLDHRYTDADAVASHDKQLLVALPAMRLADVAAVAEGYDVIAVDEGQFFPDIVDYAEAFANKGKVVIIAALDGDFRRKPFGRVLELVPMAEKVDKLTAVCTACCNDAAFTLRTVAATQIELIGGSESYRPVCRSCYVAMAAKPVVVDAAVAGSKDAAAAAVAAAASVAIASDDGEPASPTGAMHTPQRGSTPVDAAAGAGSAGDASDKARLASRTPDPSASAAASTTPCGGAGVAGSSGIAELCLALSLDT